MIKRFPLHLNNISTLHCETLWNLICSSGTRYTWVVTERNSRICPTSTVASKFARYESSWLQCVGNIAREGVQNTCHWPARTETATENRVGQLGLKLGYVVTAEAIRQWRRW